MKIKLLGFTTKKAIEKQISICASAGKLSRMPGTVFDAVESMKDYDKALKFIKRIIAMGHTSTIDHDYMVFALSGVSPVVEQTIIAERFASFTIKSRREVDFSSVGFYTPDFHNDKGEIINSNNELKKEYKKHMKELFMAYKKLTESSINKEDARFVLPYSYNSEIIMGLDGTSLVRMILNLTKGKCSNISELKELGEKLYEIAKTRAPYIEVLIEKEKVKNHCEIEEILNKNVKIREYKLVEEPVLLSYTPNIDETLFINAIARTYSFDYNFAKNVYNEKIKDNKEAKEILMKAIFNDQNHEDLKQINFRFQLNVPFAILTHYTRHRRLALSIPGFVPTVDLTKFITPPSIKNSELLDFYNDIFKNNHEKYVKFKKLGIREEDLVYFTLSGNAINVIINFDGESFRWICRLRECTKAQWCIRKAVIRMHEKISEVSNYYAKNLGPDCMTKNICGEGKESCGRINNFIKVHNKKGK